MKKVIVLFLSMFMLVGLMGCKKENEVAGKTSDLLQQIYDSLDDSVTLPFLETVELSNDMDSFGRKIDYFIGTDKVKFTDGTASESAIGSVPYSVVLLRLDKDVNASDAKKLIRDNVNPSKWICVGVDPSNVIVDNIGQLVILIMSENSSKEIHDAFKNLAK